MREIIKHLRIVIILVLIQFLLDILFVYIYPAVNPIRATLIGISALIVLLIVSFTTIITRLVEMKPYIAFIPIYSSALFGALLVQADFVKSKSAASGIAHVVILIVTYFVIVAVQRTYQKKKVI